jgi:hypothetical protein
MTPPVCVCARERRRRRGRRPARCSGRREAGSRRRPSRESEVSREKRGNIGWDNDGFPKKSGISSFPGFLPEAPAGGVLVTRKLRLLTSV